jgi:hypothetical protein
MSFKRDLSKTIHMKRNRVFSKVIIICSLASQLLIVLPVYSQSVKLDKLPNGEYYFIGPPSPDMLGKPISVLLTKKDKVVTGIGIVFLSDNHCFKGTAKENSVVKVTLGIPGSPRLESPWEFVQGPRPISLDIYTRQDLYDAAPVQYKNLHKDCISRLKKH